MEIAGLLADEPRERAHSRLLSPVPSLPRSAETKAASVSHKQLASRSAPSARAPCRCSDYPVRTTATSAATIRLAVRFDLFLERSSSATCFANTERDNGPRCSFKTAIDALRATDEIDQFVSGREIRLASRSATTSSAPRRRPRRQRDASNGSDSARIFRVSFFALSMRFQAPGDLT